jgi:putative N-acetylmannosamine-6-phosphate epimerase
MSGYTPYSPNLKGPDFKMLQALANSLKVPVIGEGRYASTSHIAKGFALGAWAIVVGSAITNPREITRQLVGAVPQ